MLSKNKVKMNEVKAEVKEIEIDKKVKVCKPRFRIKKLLNRVQEQLEFYFGDANLNHDRFLRKEIERQKDGYVSLSTMLKFNKLKQLTSDTTMLAKAVDNSSNLELCEDRTQVRRKTKLPDLENTDERTVYVENFPINIDHNWLKLVFSTCGTVEYISLPRYNSNNKVKGFAFIEFSTPEEAEKACQTLNTITAWKNKAKRRSTSESKNTELDVDDSSPNKKLNRGQRSTSESECVDKLPNIKRKRRTSEGSEASPVKILKPMQDSLAARDKNYHDDGSGVDTLLKPETSDELKISDFTSESPVKRPRRRNSSDSLEGSNDHKVYSDDGSKRKSKKTVIGKKRKFSDKDTQAVGQDVLTPLKADPNAEKNEDIGKQTSENQDGDLKSESENECYQLKRKGDPSDEDVSAKKSPLDKDLLPAEKIQTDAVRNEDEVIDKSIEENGKTNVEENGKTNVRLKKNRQHPKKGKKDPKEISVPPLHVIPKSEWVMLKKEYKRLQRLDMAELKRNLKVLKIEKVRREELRERIFKSLAAKGCSRGTEGTVPSEELSVRETMLEEKENCELSDEKPEKSEVVDSKTKGIEFSSGTVVALKTSSEKLTKKDIRNAMSTFAEVAYVDFLDGLSQGFVRLATSSDVEKIISVDCSEKKGWNFEVRKLSNDEEKAYFEKAAEDRVKKYDKQMKKKQKKERGVDKISRHVENISNHIRFD